MSRVDEAALSYDVWDVEGEPLVGVLYEVFARSDEGICLRVQVGDASYLIHAWLDLGVKLDELKMGVLEVSLLGLVPGLAPRWECSLDEAVEIVRADPRLLPLLRQGRTLAEAQAVLRKVDR